MPLQKVCSLKAFQSNIDTMRHEKFGPHEPPDDQTLAIAYSTLRKACGVPRKSPKMTPKTVVRVGKSIRRKKKKMRQESNERYIRDVLNEVRELC